MISQTEKATAALLCEDPGGPKEAATDCKSSQTMDNLSGEAGQAERHLSGIVWNWTSCSGYESMTPGRVSGQMTLPTNYYLS